MRVSRASLPTLVALLPLAATGAGAQTTTTFPGGSLSDLETLSPDLIFDDLVITGDLELEPSDGSVEIQAESVTISPTGRISYSQSVCSYSDAPHVSILANHGVAVLGDISLNGKSGSGETETSTCNRCGGRDGGNIRIEGEDIQVAALLTSFGGSGSNFTISIGGTIIRTGCDGGDGGDIELVASDSLDFDQAIFQNFGGSRGLGNGGSSSHGDAGLEGLLEWVATDIEVEEIEPNGKVSNARTLLGVPLELRGFVNQADDAAETDFIFINYGPGVTDRLEDLHRIEVDVAQTLKLTLIPDNPNTDLDFFLLNSNATVIVAQSNGPPPGNEQITTSLSAGTYLAGVSICCDGDFAPGTNYTLRIGDAVAPPPPPPDPPPGLTIVDVDAPGDGLSAFDLATRLDWLNLTQTRGLSYDEIEAGAGGWVGSGWRHATASEVCGLFARYGYAPSPCPNLFGTALSADVTSELQYVLGITGRDIFNLGATTATVERTEGLFTDANPTNSNVGFASMELTLAASQVAVQNDARAPSWSDPRVGHFLVRERSMGLFRADREQEQDERKRAGVLRSTAPRPGAGTARGAISGR